MSEPVRVPKNVLDELESVRRYTRVEVLDIPTLRYVAMETHKPALVTWIDRHEGDYARGLLDGVQEEDQAPAELACQAHLVLRARGSSKKPMWI